MTWLLKELAFGLAPVASLQKYAALAGRTPLVLHRASVDVGVEKRKEGHGGWLVLETAHSLPPPTSSALLGAEEEEPA